MRVAMIKEMLLYGPEVRTKKKQQVKNGSNLEYELLMELIRCNKLKRVDKRLQVIRLHMEGNKQQEIADMLGYTRQWVNTLIGEYKKKGLEEYARHKYGGNNRAMSIEEEEEILKGFEKESEAGKLVVATTIKKAFDKKRGKDTGRGYIYMLLKRHKGRKVMPRPAHPKKASEEDIESSKKKLIFDTGN